MRSRALSFVLVALCLAVAPEVRADDAERAERELEALRDRIGEVRAALAADRERRDDVSTEIQRVEGRIAEVSARIAEADRRIADHRVRLESLARERDGLAADLERHGDRLAEQVRAAWQLGRQPALRLVLRQDEPAALSRTMAYYAYFNRARVAAMEETARLYERVDQLERETAETERRLAGDRDELARQRERMESARVERQRLIARLDEEIAERGQRLERMEANRERLERLLEQLGSLLADIPEKPLETEPFGSMNGRLDWPADGRVRERFGGSRAGGRLRWQGIVIDAPVGNPVRAVHHGRVVFADWLSGFGQLIIIDHQDGHMSLYGYNERLARSEGDWVSPGEPIAAVGDSGGQRAAGLYFEIRRQGRPVDPLPWLASR